VSERRVPALIKRNTILLASTQAFVGAGSQLTPALGAIMIVQLLGSSTLAGLGTSMLSVAKFLVAYPIGWVADTVGRRAALFIGLSLSLVGTLLIGTAMIRGSFPLLVAGLLVFGLGIGAGQQLRLAAADLFPPDRRAQGLGYVLTGSLVGVFGGPLLITVAQLVGPRLAVDPIALAWFLVPIVLIPSMGLVFLIHPDPKDIATHLESYYGADVGPLPTVGEEGPDGNSVRAWLAHYPLRVAFVASFAAQGTMSLMMAMTSLALDHHGHALQAISIAVSIHVVGMYGLSIPLGRLTDRVGRRNVMVAGTLMSALGSVLIPASPEYWVITAGTFLVDVGTHRGHGLRGRSRTGHRRVRHVQQRRRDRPPARRWPTRRAARVPEPRGRRHGPDGGAVRDAAPPQRGRSGRVRRSGRGVARASGSSSSPRRRGRRRRSSDQPARVVSSGPARRAQQPASRSRRSADPARRARPRARASRRRGRC
jgi:MFS family permease